MGRPVPWARSRTRNPVLASSRWDSSTVTPSAPNRSASALRIRRSAEHGRRPIAYDRACRCLGSRRWPSTTAEATSESLRLASREWSRSISKAVVVVDRVAFHQDALRPLDDRPAPERALEVVVLGEAPERRCRSSSAVLRVSVRDVGEDTPLGRLADEGGVRPWSRAITGQAASRTICSISSSACSELAPRPTSATSGRSRAVTAPTS